MPNNNGQRGSERLIDETEQQTKQSQQRHALAVISNW
jgi:hypothetical protein